MERSDGCRVSITKHLVHRQRSAVAKLSHTRNLARRHAGENAMATCIKHRLYYKRYLLMSTAASGMSVGGSVQKITSLLILPVLASQNTTTPAYVITINHDTRRTLFKRCSHEPLLIDVMVHPVHRPDARIHEEGGTLALLPHSAHEQVDCGVRTGAN